MNIAKAVGKELLHGNFGNAVAIAASAFKSDSSELIQPSVWRNGMFFFGVNGADKAFVWGNFNSSLVAYQQCPVVSSIINKKAKCLINGQRKIFDKENKVADTKEAKAIQRLLNHPNPLQSGLQFRAQGSVYRQIYGYCPVLIIKPVGFENDYSAWKMWNIPPWMLQLVNNTNLFYEQDFKPFTSIRLSYMGHSSTIDPNAIFFIKENQISTGTYQYNSSQPNSSLFLPDSRLMPLEKPINSLVASIDSRGAIITDRGPMWMLSNDSNDTGEAGLFPIDPEIKKDLHEDFKQYGILKKQKKAIITDAKLKLQTVGFNVEELQLLPGEVQDAKHIADGLDYPPYLLGLIDAKYDNQDIAERALYTNSIIPDAISEDEQLSALFGLEELGLTIKTDFTHLPALQENEEKKGRGLLLLNQASLIAFMNNIITWNEWRVQISADTDPKMDGKYYKDLLKEGWVFGTVPNMALPVEAQNRTQQEGSQQQTSN